MEWELSTIEFGLCLLNLNYSSGTIASDTSKEFSGDFKPPWTIFSALLVGVNRGFSLSSWLEFSIPMEASQMSELLSIGVGVCDMLWGVCEMLECSMSWFGGRFLLELSWLFWLLWLICFGVSDSCCCYYCLLINDTSLLLDDPKDLAHMGGNRMLADESGCC